MPDVVIENPIVNSPFEELTRHFYFGETGITDKMVDSRRLFLKPETGKIAVRVINHFGDEVLKVYRV